MPMSKTNEAAQKFFVKTTGTYAERARHLAPLLEQALNEVLGANYLYEKRGDDPAKPTYWWDLKDKVSVHITRSFRADPRIWVYREDPIKEPPGETDWKHEYFERDAKSDGGCYDLCEIALYVKAQLEYNRKKLAEHQENQKALGEELAGVTVPSGMSVKRDLKTGHYEVCMEVSLKEINASETKTVIEAFRQLKAVVAPLEPKKVSDEE